METTFRNLSGNSRCDGNTMELILMTDLSHSGHALYKGKWYYIIKSTSDTLTLWDTKKDVEFHVSAKEIEKVEYEWG